MFKEVLYGFSAFCFVLSIIFFIVGSGYKSQCDSNSQLGNNYNTTGSVFFMLFINTLIITLCLQFNLDKRY